MADCGVLTSAVTNGILSSEEDRHGAAKEEAYNTVRGYRSFRHADSLGVPKSQSNASVSPTSQPK
jgi:hypothetical protein